MPAQRSGSGRARPVSLPDTLLPVHLPRGRARIRGSARSGEPGARPDPAPSRICARSAGARVNRRETGGQVRPAVPCSGDLCSNVCEGWASQGGGRPPRPRRPSCAQETSMELGGATVTDRTAGPHSRPSAPVSSETTSPLPELQTSRARLLPGGHSASWRVEDGWDSSVSPGHFPPPVLQGGAAPRPRPERLH